MSVAMIISAAASPISSSRRTLMTTTLLSISSFSSTARRALLVVRRARASAGIRAGVADGNGRVASPPAAPVRLTAGWLERRGKGRRWTCARACWIHVGRRGFSRLFACSLGATWAYSKLMHVVNDVNVSPRPPSRFIGRRVRRSTRGSCCDLRDRRLYGSTWLHYPDMGPFMIHCSQMHRGTSCSMQQIDVSDKGSMT